MTAILFFYIHERKSYTKDGEEMFSDISKWPVWEVCLRQKCHRQQNWRILRGYLFI